MVRHLPGESMGAADALSRMHFDESARQAVGEFATEGSGEQCGVARELWLPPIPL